MFWLRLPIMKLTKNLLIIGCMCLVTLLSTPGRAQATNEPSEPEKKKLFIFEGGNPIDFVVALDKHFRTRLIQILTLPDTLRRTQVPKLRVVANDPTEVLTLYNRLESPTLGQWRFHANGEANTNMNVLMLVPDKSVAAAKLEANPIKVKALALANIPEAKWDAVSKDIATAQDEAQRLSRSTSEPYQGNCRFQRDSKVLIVSGPEAYIDMVDSVLAAHRTNAEIEAKASSTSKPGEAEQK